MKLPLSFLILQFNSVSKLRGIKIFLLKQKFKHYKVIGED